MSLCSRQLANSRRWHAAPRLSISETETDFVAFHEISSISDWGLREAVWEGEELGTPEFLKAMGTSIQTSIFILLMGRGEFSLTSITSQHTDRWLWHSITMRVSLPECLLTFITSYLTINPVVCCVPTVQDTGQLQVPRVKTDFGRCALSYAAPQIWNHIPAAIKVSPSPDSFKRHLKTHYFTSP